MTFNEIMLDKMTYDYIIFHIMALTNLNLKILCVKMTFVELTKLQFDKLRLDLFLKIIIFTTLVAG